MRYHVIIDDGWREVEWCDKTHVGRFSLVRDVHRDTYDWVDRADLKTIVPRSEWENSVNVPEVFQRTFEAKEQP